MEIENSISMCEDEKKNIHKNEISKNIIYLKIKYLTN